jgi:hypothetical protein
MVIITDSNSQLRPACCQSCCTCTCCVYEYVLYFTYCCSLFEEEISRMTPQAIVPPLPLQPTPTVGEYMLYIQCIQA